MTVRRWNPDQFASSRVLRDTLRPRTLFAVIGVITTVDFMFSQTITDLERNMKDSTSIFIDVILRNVLEVHRSRWTVLIT